MKACHSQSSGLAAIEVLAIAVILGVAAFILVPRLTSSSDVHKQQESAHHKAMINAAVERYFVKTGQWPSADLADIALDTTYFPQGLPSNPLNGSAYKLNATTHRVE